MEALAQLIKSAPPTFVQGGQVREPSDTNCPGFSRRSGFSRGALGELGGARWSS